MKYNPIQIPNFLQDNIHSFWTLEDATPNDSSKEFRTIADGCPGLIFQHSKNGILYQNNKELPPIFLYGQATKHNTIQ